MSVRNRRPLIRTLVLAGAGLLLGAVAAERASAQVFYEPVQYQFSNGNHTFYYGGHDPRMFSRAMSDIDRTTYQSAVTRESVVHRTRVYSDAAGYQDVGNNEYTTYAGYTPNDARNEAYNNVPRYFRKRDLLRSPDVYVTPDATVVVPAYAEPRIEIRAVRPFGASSSAPVLKKGEILIIPKKVDPKQDKSVAMAE